MARSKRDLAYTESKSRSNKAQVQSHLGQSSADSLAIEEQLEREGKKADGDHGRFYLENATGTEF